MERTKWTERKFTFDCPEGCLPVGQTGMPDILERLRGTGARITEMTRVLSEEDMQRKEKDKWSIKEHIGHLADLEELHEGRIDDFMERKEILRAADMSNAKTNLANHNQKDLSFLLQNFIKKREQFISRLEKLDDETQYFKALHPRLQVIMRPVDMAFFVAEHDDHHLASMRELLTIP